MKKALIPCLVAVLLAGCTTTSHDSTSVTVFAAASLEASFSSMQPPTPAHFSFDGSSGLLDQIMGGAPADIFASADETTMRHAEKARLLAGKPVMFATNTMVLITPADNPAKITGLDGSLKGAKLVTCAPEVPCGRTTRELARLNNVTLTPVSEESKVTDVLGKVTVGEADAGVVYATDAKSVGKVISSIAIPYSDTNPNTYWIAPVTGGNEKEAQKFIHYVLNDGQNILAGHGFTSPKSTP